MVSQCTHRVSRKLHQLFLTTLAIIITHVRDTRDVCRATMGTELLFFIQPKFFNIMVRHMKLAILLSSLLLLMAFANGATAQRTITGTVKDAVDGSLLPGVNVAVKGVKGVGSTTSIDGAFTIKLPNGTQTLVVSFIGYASQEVAITNQTKVEVLLQASAQKIDEVVVTALGIKRDKKTLGYAVQDVKGEQLLSSREVNVANSLSGKIAGLQIVRSSNGPGGSSKIVLRGNNSLTGSNQPLIVVDGVPMDNFTGGVSDQWGNKGPDMGSGIADLNAEDIESMSVLKGASAAALYGSRAGSGVILVTTKKGKKNAGAGITLSSGVSFETILLNPDMQDTFGQGFGGIHNGKSEQSWGPKIEGQEVEKWDGTKAPLRAYDNVGSFFKTGTAYNHSITFQQDVNGTSVFASIARSDDQSKIPNAELNKTAFTLRATTDLGKNKRWHFDSKVTYTNAEAKNRPIQGSNPSNAFSTIYSLPRTLDVNDFNPSVDAYGTSFWYLKKGSSQQENPWWYANYNQNKDTRDRVLGMMSLKYDFTKWLNLEVKGGTDFYSTKTEGKIYTGGQVTPKGAYREGKLNFYENNYSFLLSARKDNFLLEKFGGFATLGGNLMHRKRSNLEAKSGELNIPNYFNINNGINKPEVTTDFSEKKINSLYGMMGVNWDGYLFLEGTFRNDWSSALSKDNRSFFYPSVNFSTIITEMLNRYGVSKPDWLTFMKLRASYAMVGNDLEPYQLYNTFEAGKDPNGNAIVKPKETLYDPTVRSELIKSSEIGLDMKFFNNRLGVDVAYYKTNATRQLLDIPIDPLSGYLFKKINAGNIQNEGFEMSINGQILNNWNGLSWDASLNMSRNVNKIISLHPESNVYDLGGYDDVKIIAQEGRKYGDIYGYRFKRVEDKTSPYYGKIIVDDSGLTLKSDKMDFIGNQQPDFMAGITNSFAYKGISLSFLVDMKFGGKIFSGTASSLYASGVAAGTVVDGKRDKFIVPNTVVAKGTGYAENTVAVTPQDYWGRVTSGNLGLAEAFTYSATSVRLRSLNLGYSLNQSLLSKTPFTTVKFSFTGNNLWLIKSSLPGIDPESVATTNTNATGLELGASPTSRIFSFNVIVGF